MVQLVGAGSRLTRVSRLAGKLEGLGAVEGGASPDLGRLLRPKARCHRLGGLSGLSRRRTPLNEHTQCRKKVRMRSIHCIQTHPQTPSAVTAAIKAAGTLCSIISDGIKISHS